MVRFISLEVGSLKLKTEKIRNLLETAKLKLSKN